MTSRLRLHGISALALTIQLATGSAKAQTADSRLEDRLLLGVATRELRDSEFRCVRKFVNPAKLEFRDVSSWLLQRLRREQPSLRHCGPADSLDYREELWLGPVVWRQPSKEATVHFGDPFPIIGRDGYFARRGRFGRWHFTRTTRE
jgi:hypothetical protein